MKDGPSRRKGLAGSAVVRVLAGCIVAAIRAADRIKAVLIRRSNRYRRGMKSPVPAPTGTFVRRTAGSGSAGGTAASKYPNHFAIEAEPVILSAAEARMRRRKRLKEFRLKRRIRASVWQARRKIAGLHRRTPSRRLAAIYVGAAAVIVIAVGWRTAFLNHPPLGDKPAEHPPREESNLLASAARQVSEKDHERAEKTIEDLRRQNPDDPRVFLAAGALEASRKNYPAARASFEKALAIRPGLRPAIFNLAEVEFATGNYAAAQSLYHRLQEGPRSNTDGMLCFRLYLCARLLGDTAGATAVLEHPGISQHSVGWLYTKSAEALLDGKKS
ncbi:MAG TPA: hypothetical protein PLS03_06440, partial [Terrimicrobiaceae bacterium]|nr:hypothetical protein [Terrimicrobiaceae bacterium]